MHGLRSSKRTINWTLCDFLRRLNQNSSTMVDFNLLDINWSTLSGCSSRTKFIPRLGPRTNSTITTATFHSPASSLFCDCVFDCNLCQLVTYPTHIKGNILDLVLTTNDEAITSVN